MPSEMSGDTQTIFPSIKWAQRSDRIYLTINVTDCKDADIKFNDKGFTFKGKGGEGKLYSCDMKLFGEIDVAGSKYAALDREIPMLIIKKEEGPYWPRLLEQKGKVHYVHTDFDKWVDEDESDNEAGGPGLDNNFEEMMAKMGNFNAGADEDAGDLPDSDDEDLPDLE